MDLPKSRTPQRSSAYLPGAHTFHTSFYPLYLDLHRPLQVAADFRFYFAYTLAMGEMKRAIAYEERQRQVSDRFASTLVIAASIIAAVRLARDDIRKSSPRLTAVIQDCVGLARMILNQIVR